jgi:protease I
MADTKLAGKKVILAADMFERVELEEPRKALENAGAQTELVSIHDGEIQGVQREDDRAVRRRPPGNTGRYPVAASRWR